MESEEEPTDWAEDYPIRDVKCSDSDCDNDLHCFLRPRPRDESYRNNVCVECGVDLIDWNRIDKRNLKDSQYTFTCLKYELVRHHYWHIPIDPTAKRLAMKKGLDALALWVPIRLRRSVGPPRGEIFRDGMQTPKRGNIVYYAQHATATCCRRCMEEWHGIGRDERLSEGEISYFTGLVLKYIVDRMPELAKEGTRQL